MDFRFGGGLLGESLRQRKAAKISGKGHEIASNVRISRTVWRAAARMLLKKIEKDVASTRGLSLFIGTSADDEVIAVLLAQTQNPVLQDFFTLSHCTFFHRFFETKT